MTYLLLYDAIKYIIEKYLSLYRYQSRFNLQAMLSEKDMAKAMCTS